jgi:hypothetical protein
MLALAIDGITSFSIKPIRIIRNLGILTVFVTICVAIYTLIVFLTGQTVDGWSSLMLSIWFLGGVQLISIGLIGEYVGKTYIESKRRPRYIIEKNLFH